MTETFAIISTREITDLCKQRPSAVAVLTYTTLLTYAQGKTYAFPSIATIRERMGNVYSRSAIMRALQWLDLQGFISRGKKRSKERFKLLKRVARQAAEQVVSSVADMQHSMSQIRHHKKTKEKKSFFKIKKSKNKKSFTRRKEQGYGRFHSTQNEAMKEPKSAAEAVFMDWVLHSQHLDVQSMSAKQKTVILTALRSSRKEDKDWVNTMSFSQRNEAIFSELLQS